MRGLGVWVILNENVGDASTSSPAIRDLILNSLQG